MSKRKHSALEDDLRPEGANDFRAARLRHRFERGTQLLFRALKTARGFERQKLGRRQKTAGKDGDNNALSRLGAEVRVLKVRTLDLWPLVSGRTLTTIPEPQLGRNGRAVFTQTTAKD